MLGGLSIEAVLAQTAKQNPITVSGGADSRDRASGGVLELFEARVCLERLAERPCTLWTDAVAEETANGGQISVSVGADSRIQGGGQRTRRFAALY